MSSFPVLKRTIIISFLIFIALCYPGSVQSSEKADLVIVIKSEYKLYLIKEGKLFAAYPVVFGANPKGHKQQQGDNRTPEGEYILDYKNVNSKYYKSIHISYPNSEDRESARKRGVSPGGDIMIHGQPNKWGKFSSITQLFNWTNGCIALSDSDMDAVWNAVDPGTPIQIRP